MMSQKEIDDLIISVESGGYRIQDALNDVATAQKGADVRAGIYGALLNAYKDGKAGTGGDAVARAEIRNLRNNTPTNDDYAAMEYQMMQLRELAHIIDTGNTGVVDVEPVSYTDVPVTFNKAFTTRPRVFATVNGNSTGTKYGLLSVAVPNNATTNEGCTVRIYNTSDSLFKPMVNWLAVGEVEVATDYSTDSPSSGTDVTAEMAYSLWAILQKCAFSTLLTAAEKTSFKTAWGIDDGGYTPPDEPDENDTTARIVEKNKGQSSTPGTYTNRDGMCSTALYELGEIAGSTYDYICGLCPYGSISPTSATGRAWLYNSDGTGTAVSMYGSGKPMTSDGTEGKISIEVAGGFTSASFVVMEEFLPDSYLYIQSSGKVLFAGKNTPYYGMQNVSEAG